MYRNKLIKAIKKVYPRFGLKSDDIILASYPKSGNTWVRFIWLNMVRIKELDEIEINFHSVNGPLNAEYDTHSYGEIDYNSLPRLVKTHMPCDRRFLKNKSIYLVRNPGDVMVSYFEFKKASIKEHDKISDISDFIRSEKFGLEKWCMHVKSWEEKANIIIEYEQLKKDALSQIKVVLQELNLSDKVKDETIKRAIRNSSFKQMRQIEEEKGRPSTNKQFKKNYKFTRKGRVGEWKNRFNDNDINYMTNMLREYDLENYYRI